MDKSNYVKKVLELEVVWKRPAGRPRMTRKEVVISDMRKFHLDDVDMRDRPG